MTEKQKKKYQTLSDKDQERFENQTKMLQEKGYFILENGSKSTDDQNVSKLNNQKKKKTASEEPQSSIALFERPKKK